MAEIDYKAKYYALRDKLIRVMDFSYREGYEAGLKEAQVQQIAQQQQEQQAMLQQQAQMAAQQQQQAAGEMPQEEMPQEEVPQEEGPSEDMDEYIQELESLISKNEGSTEDLLKSIEKIKSHRLSVKLNRPKPIKKFSLKASKNLPQGAKEALTKQHMIVENVLKKWEEESQQAISDMSRLIGVDTVVKKG